MRLSKKILVALMSLMLMMSFVSCTSNKTNENAKKGIEITDAFDRKVSLDKPAEKVVSLSPEITEDIYALGKGSTLIGRTEYCDYPAEVSKVPSVGTIDKPNIEKIVELKPDIVLASRHFPKEVLEKLESLNIKVAVFYGDENIDGAYKLLKDVAKVYNDEPKADEIIANMKKKYSKVEAKVKNLPKKKVYYVVGFGKDDFTAGGDTFIGKMIELSGGDNIAKDIKGYNYSFEKILENNPDIIICSKQVGAKEALMNDPKYKQIPAVKEGRVYEVDENPIVRQSARQSDGFEEMAKTIHPEAFNNN